MKRKITSFTSAASLKRRESTHLLRPAMESLLAQNIPDYEIILVDDGSKDLYLCFAEERSEVYCDYSVHR